MDFFRLIRTRQWETLLDALNCASKEDIDCTKHLPYAMGAPYEVMAKLIEYSSSVDTYNTFRFALHEKRMLPLFLNHPTLERDLALYQAIQCLDEDVAYQTASTLLERGANPNYINWDTAFRPHSLLYMAGDMQRLEIVLLLLRHGASPFIREWLPSGYTPIQQLSTVFRHLPAQYRHKCGPILAVLRIVPVLITLRFRASMTCSLKGRLRSVKKARLARTGIRRLPKELLEAMTTYLI